MLAAILVIVLVLATGALLFSLGRRTLVPVTPASLAGLVTPLALWVMFGIGALGVLPLSSGARSEFYGVPYGNVDVIVTVITAIFAGVAFLVGFHAISRADTKSKNPLLPNRGKVGAVRHVHVSHLWVIIWVLLAIQSATLIWQTQAQTLYAWSPVSPLAVVGGPIETVRRLTWLLLLAALLNSPGRDRWKRLRWILIIGVLFVPVLTGERRFFIFAALVFLGVLGDDLRVRFGRSRASNLVMLGTVGVAVAIILSSIQVARIEARFSADNAGARYATYLELTSRPAAALGDSSSLMDAITVDRSRLLGWTSYLSSIIRRRAEGAPFIGMGHALTVLTVLSPGSQGLAIDASADIYSQFGVGDLSSDVTGSAVTDAYSHAGETGVIVIFGAVGLVVGFWMRLLRHGGVVGAVIAAASLPMLIPIGDSFLVYLSGVRNMILVGGTLLLTARWIPGAPTRQRTSISVRRRPN